MKSSLPAAANADRADSGTEPEPASRIAICIPSTDLVHADFAMCLCALTYLRIPAGLVLINNKGSILPQNRNKGVEEALNLDVSHILFLDSDMVFPPDTLARLLQHDRDIVGCTYARRFPPHLTLGQPLDGLTLEASGGLHEVAALPTGVLLVRSTVFARLRRPYFRFETVEEAEGIAPAINGEDYVFCRLAREAGFRIWLDVDLSMLIGHLGQQTFRLQTDAGGATVRQPG
ncbi:MAG: hypothetical protein NVS9B10_21510 [Nevskia sp.]